ncbi:glycerophosphoryl diester phosphodiesterase [Rhodovulum iodosum]|uniref:glycerophosphodiester phosphodiesterase n=1 Tax=Rhodovulum iodosum TaxID=68291 RepID=A0ABV3XXY4_9RHOB|nr:glycerophosphodiester phosphodiesterase family protein [Rhodovulum robiginosum]RSK38147.1 glycerophosphodiester phosphodiesterase [Rhodovulum robiginosum]
MTITRLTAAAALLAATALPAVAETAIDYGPRPAFLIDKMEDGPLKDKLASCLGQTPKRTDFSIGHRGAALMFPEHTRESYVAGARMGAGILECDVTFTKDKELVCRHAQNDLATTTDILVTDLAGKCVTPFTPANGDEPAGAECRTAELTLAEFKSLSPKMDAADKSATTPEAFQGGVADWRTTLYANDATIMTHEESIELFKSLGVKFTPELKGPSVEMPFDGFTQQAYAQKMIDEYKAAGVAPEDVFAQSFDLSDILYWIENEPEFGAQAVYLDDRYEASDEDEGLIDPNDPATFKPTMQELADMGVNYIAPPMWMLVTVEDSEIVPSAYTREAQAAGLDIITWTMERSGPLATGGGWYFQSLKDVTDNDGVYFELLDVLAQEVGVTGVFSDWPATVTYYANCMGL